LGFSIILGKRLLVPGLGDCTNLSWEPPVVHEEKLLLSPRLSPTTKCAPHNKSHISKTRIYQKSTALLNFQLKICSF
jgi:hypothetical protein